MHVFTSTRIDFSTGRKLLQCKNYSKALECFKKAADQGNARAQYNLGCSYEYGEGVSKDINEAKNWYKKAADQGFEEAINALKRF